MTRDGYDLIGDTHGHGDTLAQLLTTLGYTEKAGVFEHPTRRVIFLGDFIDRGQQEQRTLTIARRMVETGNALAVMGNHEFNALAFGTKGSSGEWLRPHTDSNCKQTKNFLAEYPFGSSAHREALEWFRTLPLWLELDGLRVIHAYWSPEDLSYLETVFAGPVLTDDLLEAASEKGSRAHGAIEHILKGLEVPLPKGISFQDKEKKVRTEMRVRWWGGESRTYRDLYLGPAGVSPLLPDTPVAPNLPLGYPDDAPPVFLGHYWLRGTPSRLTPKVACLDYSVAQNGQLVAYRWDGEQELDNGKFVAVDGPRS